MLSRSSIVNHLELKIISFAAILQIGDSTNINGFSRALAVQREEELFLGNEGNFASYPIFRIEHTSPYIDEVPEVYFETHNYNPFIRVNHVDIIGATASSIVHVGNSGDVFMESRIKHIRQLRER